MEAVMVKGLYGSMVSIENEIGYCKRHGCYLTCKTLKKHECLKKQCHHLDKHEDKGFWQTRAKKKEMKKMNKIGGWN